MADYRFKRPDKYIELYDELVKGDESIFNTYKDLMLFSACYGFKHKKRLPVGTSSKDPIRLTIFQGSYDINVINGIALAETGDPKILSNEQEHERYKIFEEYSCGGLELIDTKIKNYSSTSFSDRNKNVLLNIIVDQRKKDEDNILGNLSDLY